MEEYEVRNQLDVLANNSHFSSAERLMSLLRFVVEARLEGKEYLVNQKQIAISVFDRDDRFDSAIDSIVRVEASRLRSKLLAYYLEDGKNDAIKFELPKGQYLPQIIKSELQDNYKSYEGDTGIPSIAILPFENMSDDKEQEYFGDGIAEDLLTDLARFSGLHVIARNSSFRYKDSQMSVREIGEELNVSHILEGSVRKASENIRITAQLIDVKSQHHLWAERYDRHLNDIFTVQDDVVSRIVEALQIRFSQLANPRSRVTDDVMKSYDLVLQGYSRAIVFTRESNNTACELYEKALEFDHTNASAYARLSIALIFQAMMGWCSSQKETIESAVMQAQQAVKHDKSLALAHAASGWAYNWSYNWRSNADLAIDECRYSVELGPSDATCHMYLALTLSPYGYYEEALELLNKARQLDPHDQYFFPRGHALFYGCQFKEAIELFKKSIENRPHFIPSRIMFASACGHLGLINEGRKHLDMVEKISPDHIIGKTSSSRTLIQEGLDYLKNGS